MHYALLVIPIEGLRYVDLVSRQTNYIKILVLLILLLNYVTQHIILLKNDLMKIPDVELLEEICALLKPFKYVAQMMATEKSLSVSLLKVL